MHKWLAFSGMTLLMWTTACADPVHGDPVTGEDGGTGGGQGGSAGTGATGGAGTAGVAGESGTGGGCGPCTWLEECYAGQRCVTKLVAVSGGFSIDATEVTRSQYEAWLAMGPSPTQPSYCSWNVTFAPDADCMTSWRVCQGNGCGNHPQVCIDWCDATAYCKASGKRLCGRIGGGAAEYPADYEDPAKSQWYNACSSGGDYSYPYGDTYEEQTCNGNHDESTECEAGACTTAEVGKYVGCASPVAGYAGVYDLSGNVWEWEDSCDASTGGTDRCRPRGGSFGSPGDGWLGCGAVSGVVDREYSEGVGIGFRCCSP